MPTYPTVRSIAIRSPIEMSNHSPVDDDDLEVVADEGKSGHHSSADRDRGDCTPAIDYRSGVVVADVGGDENADDSSLPPHGSAMAFVCVSLMRRNRHHPRREY
jgi:hypothetical protein